VEFAPGGWSRLRVLLDETQWPRRRAIFVLAGLDPDGTIFHDHIEGVLTTRLLWLPEACPAVWREMPTDRIQRRAERSLAAIETRLFGAPSTISATAGSTRSRSSASPGRCRASHTRA
jgi:hypothetical protein